MPPLRGTGFTDMMAGRAQDAGLASVPRAGGDQLARVPETGRRCVYHGYCTRGGCHVDAKNSTAVTTIPRAQEDRNLKVVTRAHVTRIEVDANGRVDRRAPT